jgi:hypothetical protein
MDQNLALLSTGTGGTILGVLILLYRTFNKKRLRSSCCGYKVEVSMDVSDISPEATKSESMTSPSFAVENPLGSNHPKHPVIEVLS